MSISLGAYVLPGDPVWLRSSLARYYDLLDDLVVPVPRSGRGWTGRTIPVDECRRIIADIDVRGIAREVPGDWVDPEHPMVADTAQRQAALDALVGHVEWVLQIDNDEVLPSPQLLVAVIAEAHSEGFDSVEWPLRVLYRSLGTNRFLSVAGAAGAETFEYPGPVAIRPTARLVEARRPAGDALLRMTVVEDGGSFQLQQPVTPNETRRATVPSAAAIIHNSWGRSPAQVWRKTRNWGHAAGVKGVAYYLIRWLPSPFLWRFMRNYHPFADGLWLSLTPFEVPEGLLHPEDAVPRHRHTKRFAYPSR